MREKGASSQNASTTGRSVRPSSRPAPASCRLTTEGSTNNSAVPCAPGVGEYEVSWVARHETWLRIGAGICCSGVSRDSLCPVSAARSGRYGIHVVAALVHKGWSTRWGVVAALPTGAVIRAGAIELPHRRSERISIPTGGPDSREAAVGPMASRSSRPAGAGRELGEASELALEVSGFGARRLLSAAPTRQSPPGPRP